MADIRDYHVGLLPADNLAAPATDFLFVGSFPHVFDGANWDRIRGDQTDGLLVNLGSNNDVTVTGTVTVDTELPVAASLTDNFANPTAPAVGAFAMLWDGATWDRAPGTAADGLLVNLGANNDVTITGSVDTELPTAAALADATANPTITSVGTFLQGFNGTTWDRVRTANTGRLQVDVVTGGGADTPTNPVVNYQTSASLAAGAAVDLTTPEATSKKLRQCVVTASVPIRVRIYTVDNGVESTDPKWVKFSGTSGSVEFNTPHRNYITLGSSPGLDAFRAEVTNMDPDNAADVYASFFYED